MHLDFFSSLLAFLSAGLVFVFLFHSLKLGPILGYLVAGIVIGPFALHFIEDPEALHQVSELGLVFFLFLIGLELSPARIWHMRRAVFVLGPAQVVVSGFCLSLLSWCWAEDFIQAVVIGVSLALSSTAIGLQILSDRNEVTTPEGQNALGILIFQDLAVIPFLAILPFFAGGVSATNQFSWMSIVNPILAIALTILGGIYIVPRALRFLARSYRQELFVATSLLLVIAVAVLMRSVGLSMALGAFMGGVLLANSEFRHELQADIEPFKSLLFGLFFISLGASIDLPYLLDNAASIILASILLLVVKTLTNFLALLATCACSKIGAFKNSALLGQGGEFALVLFGIAKGFGLINQNQSTFLVGVVGLTIALTPIWYAIIRKVLKKYEDKKKSKPAFDVQPENPDVMIAGYGRFGQIVHRILRLHGIPVTILDIDHEQVEFVKKYGTKVFYGDATRLDLLKTAGIASARLFVLAIDKPTDSIKTAELIKKNFPDLAVFVRARNREHSLRLMSLGIPQKHIVRENFYSSLKLTEDVLTHLGMSHSMAAETIDSFIEHDLEVLKNQVQYLDKEDEMIEFTKKSAQALEKVFESDRQERELKVVGSPLT